MATLLGQGRKGDISLRITKSGPVADQTWSFIVQADSVNESRLAVAASVNLIIGQSTVDGVCILKDLKGSFRPENPLIWDFIGEFSSESEEGAGGTNGDPNSDPLTWVPIYRTRFERVQQVRNKDINGDTIANSAGQAFEQGIIITRKLPVWDFFQFESAALSDEAIIARSETINSAAFRGRATHTLKLDVLSSEIGFYYGQRMRLSQYQLTYDKDKWTDKREDTGTVYLDGSELKSYVADGNVILGALNGSGGKQAPGTAPAVLEFDVYEELDFNSFLRA